MLILGIIFIVFVFIDALDLTGLYTIIPHRKALSFSIAFLSIGLICLFLDNANLGFPALSIGFALLSIAIGLRSHETTEESRDRMITIGEAGIQDSIITLLHVRHRYFEDYIKYQLEYRELKGLRGTDNFRNLRLKDVTEWATWEHFRALKKAMKYKLHLKDEDKFDILRSHKILINNIMQYTHVNAFLMNRHVTQLLSGCRLLKTELEDLTVNNENFEEKYESLFGEFLLTKFEGEDFISWTDRNKEEIKDEDELFQVLSQ